MGAAQSKRNRAVSRRQADEHLDMDKRRFFEILDRINAHPKGKRKPFGPVVIEPDTRHGCWWLMRAGPDRHHHYAYRYRTLKNLLSEWSLHVTSFSGDKHGRFYTTEVI